MCCCRPRRTKMRQRKTMAWRRWVSYSEDEEEVNLSIKFSFGCPLESDVAIAFAAMEMRESKKSIVLECEICCFLRFLLLSYAADGQHPSFPRQTREESEGEIRSTNIFFLLGWKIVCKTGNIERKAGNTIKLGRRQWTRLRQDMAHKIHDSIHEIDVEIVWLFTLDIEHPLSELGIICERPTILTCFKIGHRKHLRWWNKEIQLELQISFNFVILTASNSSWIVNFMHKKYIFQKISFRRLSKMNFRVFLVFAL